MAITNDDVKKLAELARIEMSESEMKELQKDLESILGFVEQIDDVATKEKKPEADEHRNIMREDDEPHESGVFTKEILDEAPNKKDNYIKVKKIL